jgi:tight adherence protein B
MITATIVAMVFAAAFLAVLGIFFGIQAYRHSPAAQLKRRLKRIADSDDGSQAEAFTSELLREKAPSEKRFNNLPLMAGISRLIEYSGVRLTPLRFLLLSASAAGGGFILVLLLTGNGVAALLTLLSGLIPSGYLAHRRQQRLALFDEQFPDALSMVSRSLRAGHALSGAIELLSQEMPEPTRGLFRVAYEQQQLGMSMADSMASLLERIRSVDLGFFVTIVRINYETGGNLAEILDKLAETVRARQQIRRQVKVYTAEGRISGYILVLLPVAVFIAFYLMRPEYMAVFFTERICKLVLVGAVVLQVVGFMIIRKIVNIRI